MLCFYFQQLGLSYHISFATLGLLVLFLLEHKNISYNNTINAFAVAASIIILLIINLAEIGYSSEYLRIIRVSFCAFILFLLINRTNYLPLPNNKLFFSLIVGLLAIVFYQILIDPSLQIPSIYFSGLENLGDLENSINPINLINLPTYTLRTNGIFSEPSYLGMMLSCIYLFLLNSNNYLKRNTKYILIILIIIAILISGSGIGIFSLIIISIYYLRINKFKNFIPIVIILFLLFIFIKTIQSSVDISFSLLERFVDSGSEFDHSSEVRFFNPFLLIADNLYHGKLFGVLLNNYDYYLRTGLYLSEEDFPMHNGVINLIIMYGFFGIWYILKLAKNLNSTDEYIIVLTIGMQNGSFFSYEKVFLIIYVVYTLRSFKKLK